MNVTDVDQRRVLVGADPEVFVRNTRTGDFLAAYQMPGSKAKPYPTKYGALQVDGCALEFNIKPAKNRQEFLLHLHHTQAELAAKLKDTLPEAELAIIPLVEFNKDYFTKLPKGVKMLGCDPDFDAYTLDENEVPHSKQPVRTAGGHVHIGWTKDADASNLEHLFECAAIVKQLDACLFLPSLLWDDDNRRRSVYGKPGAFRPKEYGVEYRVLSNKWIEKPLLSGWIYDATIAALKLMADGYYFGDDELVQDTIERARKQPGEFSRDRKLHEDMYWYMVGCGLPEIPGDCIEFKNVRAA